MSAIGVLKLTRSVRSILLAYCIMLASGAHARAPMLKLKKQEINIAGKSLKLRVLDGYRIAVAAQGMKRIRFMAMSPDSQIFIADMHDISDNTHGSIHVLSGYDKQTHSFTKRSQYLDHLRNPNSVAFHKDAKGKYWLYIALTDRLIRYAYNAGDVKPSGDPQVLDHYPVNGLSYRYGGWHLTRTIEFGSNGKLYVSVGSSCNACVEKEETRACIIEMDPDGKNRKIIARGVRNAVGLEWTPSGLYATSMSVDHLGRKKPDDLLFKIDAGRHYGWPYYNFVGKHMIADPQFAKEPTKIDAGTVTKPVALLGAHAAPLGLLWLDRSNTNDARLGNSFLVAQHGSYTPTIGMGYSLQMVRPG